MTVSDIHEPMQVDTYHLSPEERDHRINHRLCLYCGEPGHMRLSFPSRSRQDPATQVSVPILALNVNNCITVSVTLTLPTGAVSVCTMCYSGAARNFMSLDFAQECSITLIECLSPLAVEAVDGRPLGTRKVTHMTTKLSMSMGILHQETIQLYIISTSHAPIILGLPWLHKYNPTISWQDSQITRWNENCFPHCIPSITPLHLLMVSVTETV